MESHTGARTGIGACIFYFCESGRREINVCIFGRGLESCGNGGFDLENFGGRCVDKAVVVARSVCFVCSCLFNLVNLMRTW